MSMTATLRPSQGAALFRPPSSCPNCGVGLSQTSQDDGRDAQRRIVGLESQVRILTSKATAAVDRLADYEDELRRLKSSQAAAAAAAALPPTARASTPTGTQPATANLSDGKLSPAAPTADQRSPTPPSQTSPAPTAGPVQTRFTSFLSVRKAPSPNPAAAPALSLSPSPLPTPTLSELEAALDREHRLRQAAEGKLTQANGELEELSTELFAQANEMVASERKARAKLEERVALLERRDGEKRKRLDRLESALGRIERVRGLLGKELR